MCVAECVWLSMGKCVYIYSTLAKSMCGWLSMCFVAPVHRSCSSSLSPSLSPFQNAPCLVSFHDIVSSSGTVRI